MRVGMVRSMEGTYLLRTIGLSWNMIVMTKKGYWWRGPFADTFPWCAKRKRPEFLRPYIFSKCFMLELDRISQGDIGVDSIDHGCAVDAGIKQEGIYILFCSAKGQVQSASAKAVANTTGETI